MTIEWTGQIDEDSKLFAGRHFANLQHPDDEMLPVLLFWRDTRLTHVEALDWSHFSDDQAKEQLFHREVPQLVKKWRPPDWLRPVAEWNPVSALTAATRQLWGNPNPFAASGLPAEHPIELTIIWVIVLVAIFAPLGKLKYRSMSR